MKNTVVSIIPRRTLLATLLAGFAASAFAAPNNIVISQVYGAGGNSGAVLKKDYIELFNRSAAPASLKGLYLHYHSATGTGASSLTALPDVILEPGQYFLVTAAGGSNGADLADGDHVATNINMSGTAGRVSLSTQGTSIPAGSRHASIVEMVGYGNANVSEGLPAPAASSTTSVQRKGAGCIDTDNNAQDFGTGPATSPRRLDSPRTTCDMDTGPVAAPIVTSCPATLQARQGAMATAALSASDKDSIVNGASIVSGAVAGISLVGLAPATTVGGAAQVTLQVDAGVPSGNYPVRVRFTNGDGQEASCTVNVGLAGQVGIPQIQGSGPTSPYVGTVQTTQGVVTHKLGNSFFLQDPDGDGDPTTSDGIYVFNPPASNVQPGDLVRVTGTVEEYRPSGATRTYTELTGVTGVTKLGVGPVIVPTNVELPNEDLARYEGMLVRFVTPLTVNQNKYLGDRGELTLAYGRRENPTNRHPAGSPEAAALAKENAANMLVLDDGIFTAPPVIPYLGEDGTVRAGDTVTNLTGVLDFGAIGGGGAAFKLQPTEPPVFSRTNPRTPAPALPAGIKVASANVLNFFTTFTNGGDAWGRSGQGCTVGSRTSASECRGADNMAEFVRQRNQIVASLTSLDADVIGLMEIQNNGDVAVSYLVEQLNAAVGYPVYAVVPKPAATGTDAIRVAMIYKPAVLTLAGASLSDGDRVHNRPPMAQTFKAANGAKFSVIVNHFKSKGSCSGATGGDRDPGDGQGCWDTTRLNQAARLADYFVPQVVAAAGDPDVLVIGDLNAYAFENPINHLAGKGFVNEIERFVRPHGMPYSYVFNGQAGYLDHVLASASLSPQVAGVAEWHSNADEPETLDYNLGDTAQDPYREGAYRASDHDPLLVSLNLAAPYADVTASVKVVLGGLTMNRATLKYSGKVSFTNTSGAALTGPLHFVLEGLTEGVSLDGASGTHNGAPYLTLPETTIAPGATVTVTATFSNPSKKAIGYTPKLLSGSF
ncbi:ExeM/NucH family extracellular endonuclease [Massilia consociata]|uniref:ExeM/NucH family extracellular endonuclease n=1 Tax=Massilia consociata TaxID=760117 RepID=A0ABV6FBH8_9BURK